MEYLLDTLLPLPNGGKLPSFRTIMEETGAGQLTVGHALETLRNEGAIRIDARRGIYRVKTGEQTDEIRLIHFQQGSLNGSIFLERLFQDLIERAKTEGRRITVENAGDRSPEQIAETLEAQGVQSCILSIALHPEYARCLKRRIPLCLELLPYHSGNEVPSLRDSPDMTVMQMNYLLNLGYRRIGYIHYGGLDTYLYSVQVLRLLDYYRLMAENHLGIEPDWVFHCTERCENLYDGMTRVMNSKTHPEALIVPGAVLRVLYRWCWKHGIRIGNDLAVICGDDINADLKPDATTITNSPESAAEIFWEMFRAAERGEKVENRYTELFIHTGMTVPVRARPH